MKKPAPQTPEDLFTEKLRKLAEHVAPLLIRRLNARTQENPDFRFEFVNRADLPQECEPSHALVGVRVEFPCYVTDVKFDSR